jgi:hypothetical protein
MNRRRCAICRHRLYVTLLGAWLATGCRTGLAVRGECEAWEGPIEANGRNEVTR